MDARKDARAGGKKLAIATWDTRSVNLYARQIRDFFGDAVEIATYSVQSGTVDRIAPADVYLVSTCVFRDRDLSQILPDKSEAVITEVHITNKSLTRLLAVPRNTKALVVNINQDMATETIALFTQLGVTNIQFEPYYPGIPNPPHIPFAITTGERRHCPPWAEEVLDLGPRLLSGNTLIELANRLNCIQVLEKPQFHAYLASLAERSFSIERLLNRNVQLAGLTDLFQQSLDSGIIGIDGEGTVFTCSPKAEEILGMPEENLVGRSAWEVLRFLPVAECLSRGMIIRDRTVEIQGTPVVYTLQPVLRNGALMGAFCVLQRRQEDRRLQRNRRQAAGKGHVAKYTFDSIIGVSAPMVAAKNLARKMAAGGAAILITGESGTGKELFANAIHAASGRRDAPFVAINCAAIPDSLLESQLFGYEEGAFTGAKKGGSAGFFEAANSGTLFLDEIEAMSPMLQVKLLRVLQEKEIVRLGGVDVIHVDVRIIAATNTDLDAIVRQGGFRKDLYYRLCVLPLRLPPLRERHGDVELLFQRIRDGLGASFTLTPQAMDLLIRHRWDGNVRELRNCVEYLAYLEKPVIEPEDLPPTILEGAGVRTIPVPAAPEPQPVRSPEEVLQQLRETAGRDLPLYAFTLRQLAETPGMGRKAIADAAASAGLRLSEQSARTILGRLEQLELVSVRRGRNGCQITQLGITTSTRLQ